MINNIVFISDTHVGCQMGLCPPRVRLDGGGYYQASNLQRKVWDYWKHFKNKVIPDFTKSEPFTLVHVGDCCDGVHHNSTTQITQNKKDQANIAYEVLAPLREKAARYFHIRGTGAHVGPSGELEEGVAARLGAEPDDQGNHARWELWLNLNRKLIHVSHHISGTASSSYESTGVYREMVEAFTHAGRSGVKPPDLIVRGHRHRYFKTDVGRIVVVVPGWQLKTPYVYRIASGRAAPPHFGGIVVRSGSKDPLYTRAKIYEIERPREVKL